MSTTDAGRQVDGDARAPPPEVTAGRLGGARASPLTACAHGGRARGGPLLSLRQSWLRRLWCRPPRGPMARGWLPQQSASRQARPRRPRPAPAPRPSASSPTPCGPAKADMAFPGVPSGQPGGQPFPAAGPAGGRRVASFLF